MVEVQFGRKIQDLYELSTGRVPFEPLLNAFQQDPRVETARENEKGSLSVYLQSEDDSEGNILISNRGRVQISYSTTKLEKKAHKVLEEALSCCAEDSNLRLIKNIVAPAGEKERIYHHYKEGRLVRKKIERNNKDHEKEKIIHV